jgi:hypothetical protein
LPTPAAKKRKQVSKNKPKRIGLYFCGEPPRPGIYHTSVPLLNGKGGSFSFWNGDKWMRYKNWGEMHNRKEEVVWYGEGKTRKQPIKRPDEYQFENSVGL